MSSYPRPSSHTNPRWQVPPPSLAILPGAIMLALGMIVVSEPQSTDEIGWALAVVGLCFVLIGTIAQGVAWGLALARAVEASHR